jgi:hypothetical protein
MALNPKHYRIILERELKKLHDEVSAYTSDTDLWKVSEGITNSGGNLAVHLIGNLRHYIGAVLGKENYVRDKSEEFSTKDVSKDSILADIESLFEPMKQIIDHLEEEVIDGNYPAEIEGKTYPTELILHHTIAHFSYHLGQINYHRRILGKINV